MTTTDPTDDWVPRDHKRLCGGRARCDEISQAGRKEWMKLDMNELRRKGWKKFNRGRNFRWTLRGVVRHTLPRDPWAGLALSISLLGPHSMTAFVAPWLRDITVDNSTSAGRLKLTKVFRANCVAAALFRFVRTGNLHSIKKKLKFLLMSNYATTNASVCTTIVFCLIKISFTAGDKKEKNCVSESDRRRELMMLWGQKTRSTKKSTI